jgi:hypothetical protein
MVFVYNKYRSFENNRIHNFYVFIPTSFLFFILIFIFLVLVLNHFLPYSQAHVLLILLISFIMCYFLCIFYLCNVSFKNSVRILKQILINVSILREKNKLLFILFAFSSSVYCYTVVLMNKRLFLFSYYLIE